MFRQIAVKGLGTTPPLHHFHGQPKCPQTPAKSGKHLRTVHLGRASADLRPGHHHRADSTFSVDSGPSRYPRQRDRRHSSKRSGQHPPTIIDTADQDPHRNPKHDAETGSVRYQHCCLCPRREPGSSRGRTTSHDCTGPRVVETVQNNQ